MEEGVCLSRHPVPAELVEERAVRHRVVRLAEVDETHVDVARRLDLPLAVLLLARVGG